LAKAFSILSLYLQLKLEAIHKKADSFQSRKLSAFYLQSFLGHSPRFQSWERNANPQ
jgi:hypothetical protein